MYTGERQESKRKQGYPAVVHLRNATEWVAVVSVGVSDLPSVERFVTGVVVVEEEHVDKGDEQAGSVPGGARVVRHPLIEDQDDEVAEQTGHEDDLWDESQVDVQRLLEIPAGNHEQRILSQRHRRTN